MLKMSSPFAQKRKIKRKMRKCDSSGFLGTDAVVIVSRPEEKVYRASFHKRIRVDNLDSVPFRHVKDEQSCCTSLSAS